MSIAVVGDIHGTPQTLQFIDNALSEEVVCGIQVGDLGWYPYTQPYFNVLKLKRPWYFIRGNHEDHASLLQYDTVTEVAPNLFYVPNGTALDLNGRTIAFLGGAGSVDAAYNSSWSPLERITKEEVEKCYKLKNIDVLITHTPPQEIIDKHFDPMDLVYYFGLSKDWRDPSAEYVQEVWELFGKCRILMGHMHKSVVDGNATILNIDEILCI